MIIGNRTLTTRYILPFLFDDCNIFNDKHMFVNAYVEDINRPYIENRILILFEYSASIYNKIEKVMTENKHYCYKNDVFINNKYYIEYVFIIPPKDKKTIDLIKDGYFCSIAENQKIKIISFWKDSSYSYLKDLLKKPKDLLDIKSLKERGEIVTEEDYAEEDTFVIVKRYFEA